MIGSKWKFQHKKMKFPTRKNEIYNTKNGIFNTKNGIFYIKNEIFNTKNEIFNTKKWNFQHEKMKFPTRKNLKVDWAFKLRHYFERCTYCYLELKIEILVRGFCEMKKCESGKYDNNSKIFITELIGELFWTESVPHLCARLYSAFFHPIKKIRKMTSSVQSEGHDSESWVSHGIPRQKAFWHRDQQTLLTTFDHFNVFSRIILLTPRFDAHIPSKDNLSEISWLDCPFWWWARMAACTSELITRGHDQLIQVKWRKNFLENFSK